MKGAQKHAAKEGMSAEEIDLSFLGVCHLLGDRLRRSYHDQPVDQTVID